MNPFLNRRMFPRLVTLLLVAALAACSTVEQPGQASAPGLQAPEAASGFQTKAGVQAQRFMVAAANPLATQAGYQVLKAGGSAVDAAIAVQMVLNLVEPQSSGMGGGLFLLHADGQRVSAIDGRETAPAAATPDLFLQNGKPMRFMAGVVGGRSVGTPGVVRALALAHRQHGQLPWADLFQPAIALAEQGFAISPRLASLLQGPMVQGLRQDPEAAAYFFQADGQPKAAGTVLKNPALAQTLRLIAQQGPDAFYTGAIARDVVAKVRGHARNPGLLSEADLATYQPKVREALCFDYRSARICGMPTPSSGPLAIGQMLGMLSHKPLADVKPHLAPFGLEPDARAVHWISEAGRLAYADRARYVADTDFVPLPGGSASALLSPEYLRQRSALIGERSMGQAAAGQPLARSLSLADDQSPELPSTSHVSVVDAQGRAVSMTTTIENVFGAQIMVRGFLLNNELTDFSFVPEAGGQAVANRVEAGKRPRSSMAPLLVFDRASGALQLVLGSPGGSAIPNYVLKVLVGVLDWGLDVQSAIALPNFGSRNGPTELEKGRASQALVDALKQRGHTVKLMDQTSGLQGIERITPNGRPAWLGGADPRREGVVMGD
jgi:gamma-glutamyltranspeptidase/glutathione hydrolase